MTVIFKKSEGSNCKGCTLLVFFLDLYLIITGLEVDDGIKLATMATLQKVFNSRESVGIFLGDVVNLTIINTESQGTILLLHQNHV